MFFARKGENPPCGLFSIGHFLLLIITSLIIVTAIILTRKKDNKIVHKIIIICTIIICVLEIIKIIYVIHFESAHNINEYIPLYYCSILIYAGIFSSWGKGKIKHIGDVFLATGAIVGGTIFIIFPTTSLPSYPLIHFISLHSYFFHGIMVYLGLLVNITNYVILEKLDIKYYASLVASICLIAYIVNKKFNSNLMFISQNFPGTILELFYNLLGPLYTLFISLVQIVLPFYFIYYHRQWIIKLCNKFKNI